MSYAHLFENCDHVIEGNILLDIASIPPVLKKALIFLIQSGLEREAFNAQLTELLGNDSNLLIVFYGQIMPDDFVMQLHRF